MKYNSNTNQEIKRKFVDREIFSNVNSMAEYILNKSYEDSDAPFTFEDIENYSYLDIDELINDMQDDEEIKKDLQNDYDGVKLEDLDEDTLKEIADLNGYNPDDYIKDAEIYEYYIVTSFLLNKLSEQGEAVIPHEQIWCRQTTGQAILLDHVISKIAEEMEILDGQAHSWA